MRLLNSMRKMEKTDSSMPVVSPSEGVEVVSQGRACFRCSGERLAAAGVTAL